MITRFSVHDVESIRTHAPKLLSTGTWCQQIEMTDHDGERAQIDIYYRDGTDPGLASGPSREDARVDH